MEELYVYEIQKRDYGRREYKIRRKAKKVKCFSCGYEWLIRRDREAPIYCKICFVEKEKNPMYGKIPWNKGTATFNRKEYQRKYATKLRNSNKKALIKIFDDKCKICGQKNLPICVYEFHHMEQKNKKHSVSQMLTFMRHKQLEEVKKCIMLCSNCHKIIHHGDERLVSLAKMG